MTTLSPAGGLKRWTALPRSFPMAVEGIEDRTDRPERVERMLESRAEEEANRVPVEPEVRSPVPAEEFLRLGRQKQAEKYMDTQLVAFRFEGEIEPDPSHAPIVSFHPMREVVNAMEEELYAFRPESVFGFLREAFQRFPGRLPVQDHHDGPLNDDDYAARISNAIKQLVSDVALERPAEPFEWLDDWLEKRADAEALDAARRGDLGRAAAMDVREMSEMAFREFALELFKKFDADRNGLLDPREMREVLRSAALDLTEAEQRDVLAEIDLNDDGAVDYGEFVPFLHGLMAAVRSKHAARATRDERDRATRNEAQLSFVKGMTHDELDATLRRVFEEADLDGNGSLDPREFGKALRSADLGLSKKEINLLLAESDRNADGVVDYDEFVPVCFDILVERAKNKRLESDALASTDAVTTALLDAFRRADVDPPTGKLKVRQLKHCLRTLTEDDVLPLSKSQIVAVCSEARPSPDDGLVAYALRADGGERGVRHAGLRGAEAAHGGGARPGERGHQLRGDARDGPEGGGGDTEGRVRGVRPGRERRPGRGGNAPGAGLGGRRRARVDGEADPRHRRRGGRGRRRGGGLRRARVARARDGAAARDGGRDPAQGVPERARVHRRQEGYPADARRHARRGARLRFHG